MIKIIGQSEKNIEYSVVYNQSAKVLNIDSNCMDDDCMPHRESINCMTWLDNDNRLCEIECIYPVYANHFKNWIGSETKSKEIVPKFMVEFEDKSVEIMLEHSQLVLIFNNEKVADKIYSTSNCVFYVEGDELVAIVCKNFVLV